MLSRIISSWRLTKRGSWNARSHYRHCLRAISPDSLVFDISHIPIDTVSRFHLLFTKGQEGIDRNRSNVRLYVWHQQHPHSPSLPLSLSLSLHFFVPLRPPSLFLATLSFSNMQLSDWCCSGAQFSSNGETMLHSSTSDIYFALRKGKAPHATSHPTPYIQGHPLLSITLPPQVYIHYSHHRSLPIAVLFRLACAMDGLTVKMRLIRRSGKEKYFLTRPRHRE